ncbi:hypothetical protein DDD_2028 [Nonlabens dokdonensis DSW-6]|uniref:Uncharacterized protein n=2 Tax=Nonlabens dokdonensis TaxID=328515 RepID=L7W647_NONDD|nr:hypothetical protein DDD_2028 [Nonlabens dokdonensis DSW-6]
MYCLGETFNEVSAFINGYSYAKETPISGTDFHRFVCLKNSYPTNYHWAHVIKARSKNDKEALEIMECTILKFCELKLLMNEEELIRYATDNKKIDFEK